MKGDSMILMAKKIAVAKEQALQLSETLSQISDDFLKFCKEHEHCSKTMEFT